MFLRWALISIYAIVTTILAMVITPFVVLTANRTTGRLPTIFHWMETPDQLLPGDPGLMGTPTTKAQWYWTSCKWLWRNPAYRATDFAKFIPVPTPEGEDPLHYCQYYSTGDKSITETPFKGGTFYAAMTNNEGVTVFDFYHLWRWPGTNRCVRIRLGWKLVPWFNGLKYDSKSVCGMHVISFNPVMGCSD